MSRTNQRYRKSEHKGNHRVPPMNCDTLDPMMMVLVRNIKAFEAAKDVLTFEALTRHDYGQALLWNMVVEFHAQCGELPDRKFLEAEIDNLVETDPDALLDEELDNLKEFIETAFDRNSFEKDIRSAHGRWALEIARRFLSVGLARRIREELDTSRTILADQAPVFAYARKEQARIDRLGKPAVQNIRDEWAQNKQLLTKLRERALIGLRTGITELDRRTKGLQGLAVLGAMPGIGKTSLCIEIALGVCQHQENDAVVVFVSLEMDRPTVLTRINSNLGDLDWSVLTWGSPMEEREDDSISVEDQGKIAEADRLITTGPIGERLFVLDRSDVGDCVTADDLAAIVDHCIKSAGVKRALLVIDYLQLLQPPEEMADRGDTACDRYRVRLVQDVIEAFKTADDPYRLTVLAISEARKPANSKEKWGEGVTDLMGSARLAYAANIALVYRRMTKEDLQEYYGLPVTDERSYLQRQADIGISPMILKLEKGRDGMARGEWGIEFHFRRSKFIEVKKMEQRVAAIRERTTQMPASTSALDGLNPLDTAPKQQKVKSRERAKLRGKDDIKDSEKSAPSKRKAAKDI